MKNIKIFTILLTLCALAGCGANEGLEAAINRDRMLKLENGMSKDQVLSIMKKPHKTENYGEIDIWLYRTEWNAGTYGDNSSEYYTPFVFKDGLLIGWGQRYYDETIKKYEVRIR